MATYNFKFYTDSPYNYDFDSGVGSVFTYTGPATADGTMTLTDNEVGGEGTVMDDNVGNDQEEAIADVLFDGTNTYTNRPVSADTVWTLYDPVEDRTFEVVLMTLDLAQGPNLNFTLSEYPLVPGREYTVTGFSNNADFSDGDPVFTYEDYVCFTKGTKLNTERGFVAVEMLQAGDLVETLDAGFQPVCWIGQARVAVSTEQRPVRIDAGALGNAETFVVSPLHRMLVSGWESELVMGSSEVLVAAKFLTQLDGVSKVETPFANYFHVLLDAHHLLNVEGCWAESFYPGGQSELRLDAKDQRKILSLLPELHGDLNKYGPPARICARSHEGRLIAHLLRYGVGGTDRPSDPIETPADAA